MSLEKPKSLSLTSHPIRVCLLGALGVFSIVELIRPRINSDKSHGQIRQTRAILDSSGRLDNAIDIYRTHMNEYPSSLIDLIQSPIPARTLGKALIPRTRAYCVIRGVSLCDTDTQLKEANWLTIYGARVRMVLISPTTM
jgi:hypothetical protein